MLRFARFAIGATRICLAIADVARQVCLADARECIALRRPVRICIARLTRLDRKLDRPIDRLSLIAVQS